jgi:MoxR-like ATPase
MLSRVNLELIRPNIVGLDDEVQTVLLALSEGIPLMLEGETGTGKTELAKTVTAALGRPFHRVDGNQELTAIKLHGWFDPPLVLEKGYGWDTFVAGPLVQAMLEGGVFFFNEVSRAPSEAINAVLTALDEHILTIPRLGTIEAREGFVSVFTFNPVERVATNPLPQTFYDRCVWIRLEHQPLDKAVQIVRLRTGERDGTLIRTVCQIVEATRQHPDVEHGASVRAAIHMTRLASALRQGGGDPYDIASMTRIAVAVLAKTIRLTYDAAGSPEQVVREAVDQVMRDVQRPEREELPEPGQPDYQSRFMALAWTALQAGDAKWLGELSDKNPYLVAEVAADETAALEEILSEASAIASAKLYKNLVPHLERERRRRLLRYVIPKIAYEALTLHRQGVPLAMREIRSYQVGEDWDLDATLDHMIALGEKRPSYESIRVRKAEKTKRAFVVMADKSNSLTQYVHYVSVAAAMLSFATREEHLSLLAFNHTVQPLKAMREPLELGTLLERILDLACGGATDLSKPLQAANAELMRVPDGTSKEAILISDCTPTTGGDPLPLVDRFEHLHVLYIPTTSFIGSCLVNDLERRENVHVHRVGDYKDIVDYTRLILSPQARIL